MYSIAQTNLAQAIRSSSNYKIVQHEGWLYVFPLLADFDKLAEDLTSSIWDTSAVLVIDDEGKVRFSRYGKVTPR